MMFSGPEGVGKALVARELAQSLLCENSLKERSYSGCNECKACKLLLAGNHPDFHCLDCAKKEEGEIDSFRALLHSLGLKSFTGGNRVVLVNNAEQLSSEAANLLLKTLEEPRPGNFFMLVCSNPRALPSTLLSRCQVWFFDGLSSDELTTRLTGSEPNLKELIELADGSLANIEGLKKHIELWHELSDKLSRISAGDSLLAHQMAAELAKDKDNLKVVLQLMRIYSRRAMRSSKELSSQRHWALFLSNVLTAERLIFDRYLGAGYVLGFILGELAAPRSDSMFAYPRGLLESRVV